jgi:hypothetical protein
MIKNLIVIPLRLQLSVGRPQFAALQTSYPGTKSRDLLKGKARSSSRGQQKAAPKGGSSLASSVEPKLGQAERAGVLTAVGHEAHPIKLRAQVEGSETVVAIASKVSDSALKKVIKPGALTT